MRKTILAAILSTLAFPALAQLTFPAGNYRTSISNVTFAHPGGPIAGLATVEVATCGSSHVHGAIGTAGEPSIGICGHGTPLFVSLLSVTPSGSTPNSAAGVQALTLRSESLETQAEVILAALLAGFGGDKGASIARLPLARSSIAFSSDSSSGGGGGFPRDETPGPPAAPPAANSPVDRLGSSFDAIVGRQFFGQESGLVVPGSTVGYFPDPLDALRLDLMTGDISVNMFGTPKPTPQQLRDGPPKPPPAPAANPPAQDAKPQAAKPEPVKEQATKAPGSILDSLEEPRIADVLREMNAPLPSPTAEERANAEKARKETERIFSSDATERDAARRLLPFRPEAERKLIERGINERAQRVVWDAERAAVGMPRVSN